MSENENITTMAEDDELILPDGWQEGDDIFAEEDWSGDAEQADESAPTAGQETEDDMEEADPTAPTLEQEDTQGDVGAETEAAPTLEQAEAAARKLKFTARVDRADLDVEVDESELPTLYQKAQVVDRVQAKLAKVSPVVEKAQTVAKTLGFDTLESMLDNVSQNYRDAEVQRLVSEGVHEEVAKDMVARRFASETPTSEPDATTPGQAADSPTAPKSSPASAQSGGRDFQAEVKELMTARPDLQNTRIPSEVVQECVKGKPLLMAYTEYEARQKAVEADRLQKENAILKQNAASAARAPVSGTRGGGATDTKAKDPFLEGFEDEDY